MKTIALIPAILLMVVAGCKKEQASTETPPPEIDVTAVTTDSVVLSKTYPGVLKSAQKVDLVGRVNGTLLSQNFENGQHVRRGQVLFTIEDTQYRDAVQQAQAQLANATSALEYATKNYAAMTKALESDAVSQIQVLESKNAMEQADAAVKNARAALETAQTNLGYCTVRAPFDGEVTLGVYSAGTYISGAGAPVVLATIYDNSELDAEFSIEDAAYIRSMQDDRNRHLIDYDNVPVSFSEELPHQYAGKLTYVSPDVDTGTGTLLLRVKIQSPYGELKDGMYAKIDLPYACDAHAMLVRDESISTSQTEKYLYTVNDSDQVVYTPIVVGEMANDSMRIVKSGVTPGQHYVTKALLKVRPGMKIAPKVTRP